MICVMSVCVNIWSPVSVTFWSVSVSVCMPLSLSLLRSFCHLLCVSISLFVMWCESVSASHLDLCRYTSSLWQLCVRYPYAFWFMASVIRVTSPPPSPFLSLWRLPRFSIPISIFAETTARLQRSSRFSCVLPFNFALYITCTLRSSKRRWFKKHS